MRAYPGLQKLAYSRDAQTRLTNASNGTTTAHYYYVGLNRRIASADSSGAISLSTFGICANQYQAERHLDNEVRSFGQAS